MSEKLRLTWNNFQDNIIKTFGNLREDPNYSDVTLVCEDGEQIEAHKLVLAASSHFFQKLLARTKHPHPLIYLRGIQSDDLHAIIDFVYFGEAKVYQENFDSFLCIAKEIQLQGLINQFGDGVIDFGAEKELPFEPVTGGENTPSHEETTESQKSIKAGEGIVAVSSQLSGDIESEVKSMMKKSKNRVGHQKAYVCKVCGKEGFQSSIKGHIERSHLEGFIVLCDQCEKTYTTRSGLKRHRQIHN